MLARLKKWIKAIIAQSVDNPAVAETESRQNESKASPPPVEEAVHPYFSDQPIRSKAEDRFNRWGFAKRIADTLATRKDPASLVIGLFGPWGDGKTSTLHLMEGALAEHPNVVLVRFNPWFFQSEELLLKGFFSTLAEALGKPLSTKKEDIGNLLEQYGGLLSVASISLANVVGLNLGDAAKSLGVSLSAVKLNELRDRIEKFLQEAGKRIVVLIDDIDRLDRNETHAIFKLVKLSASFNYTSYVLSFDDEVVSAALGDRYGAGDVAAGRRFLEKIIQVPLHLPPADEIELLKITFDGVEAALKLSGIVLTQDQSDAFARHFVDGIDPRLETPRQAKLYVNALTFALPLLKGEVHPVDLLLIEGIRIFYPKLYSAIRDNPEYFLQSQLHTYVANDAQRDRVAAIINEGLEGIRIQDKEQIRRFLLEVLFPRLKGMFGNVSYGPEWDKTWSQEQRICSDEYFKRYFSYSVPAGDVSDVELGRLLETLPAMSAEDVDGCLKNLAERDAVAKLIGKLRLRQGDMAPATAHSLAMAIARNGQLLPRERMPSWSTFRDAGSLVARLLKRVSDGQERETLAREIIAKVTPLSFGVECFLWIRRSERQPESDRIVAEDVEPQLGAKLVERIRGEADKLPLYQTFGEDAPRLYWLWGKYSDQRQVEEHLRAHFESNPDEVDAFLGSFVGYGLGMETGLRHRGDFDRREYDWLASIVSPDFVADFLKRRYGAELGAPEFYQEETIPFPRRIAHQFTYVHLKVCEEKAEKDG
jgi:KAP family P-loop domain